MTSLFFELRRGKHYYNGELTSKVSVLTGLSAIGKSAMLEILRSDSTTCNITIKQATRDNLMSKYFTLPDCGVDLVIIDESELCWLDDYCKSTKVNLLSTFYPKILLIGRDKYNGVPIDYKAVYTLHNTDRGYTHTLVRMYKDYDCFDSTAEKYLCEDSKSSYFYYNYYLQNVQSAHGNGNIKNCCDHCYIIADGAALGPHIGEILKHPIKGIYAPISFEYDVCKAFFPDLEVIANPDKYWDYTKYQSLEQMFTALLTHMLNSVYHVHYSKSEIPHCVMLKQIHDNLPVNTLSEFGRFCEENHIPTTEKAWRDATKIWLKSYTPHIQKAISELRTLVPTIDKDLSDKELIDKYRKDYDEICKHYNFSLI